MVRAFLVILLMVQVKVACGQFADSISYSTSFTGIVSSAGYQPLWLVSNRWGQLEDEPLSAFLRNDVFLPYENQDGLDISARLTANVNLPANDKSQVSLQQGYLGVRWKLIEIWGGMRELTRASIDDELSPGSFIISPNARPVPRVEIRLTDYWRIPFTANWLAIKGYYNHGWLEADRVIRNPLLHEKGAYVRIGPGKVNFEAGLNHLVLWGGNRNGDPVPSALADYWRVVTAQPGREGAPGGDVINVLGSQLGNVDARINFAVGPVKVTLYSQQFYEDRNSVRQLPFSQDQQAGFKLVFHEEQKPILGSMVFEYMNTVHQSGPGLPDNIGTNNFGFEYGGRDDYYNNYAYQSGYTHRDRIVGNPLFGTETRMIAVLGENAVFNNSDQSFIINNRISSWHLGASGWLHRKVSYRGLVTTTLNKGSYAGANNGRYNWESRTNPDLEYVFNPARRSWNVLFEVTGQGVFLPQLNTKAALAADFGELGQAIGFLLSVEWSGSFKLK